jgi:hypothetical protein
MVVMLGVSIIVLQYDSKKTWEEHELAFYVVKLSEKKKEINIDNWMVIRS